MSWGGQPQHGYGAYSQGQYGQQAQYGQPPSEQYGAPGQAYTQRPAYGAPSGAPSGYGGAPAGQLPRYTAPLTGQAPGYGAPPSGQSPRYGTPPGGQGYGAPQGYAPGGYGPPPGVNPELWTWFQAVDVDHSGKITATELQHAMMNGNWSPFNPETCRLMIGMFDRDRNGTIDIHEFAALWKYIQDWKACFDRFDTDRSGNIDANELGNAFQTFGYRLSPQFSQMIVQIFDRRRGGYNINFDDFIQACVMLKSLTEKFKIKDTNQTGQINISYEDFLEMVLDTTLNK